MTQDKSKLANGPKLSSCGNVAPVPTGNNKDGAMTTSSEPTAEQCNQRAKLDLGDGKSGWACWYPQMGGCNGKAVIVLDNECFNVYVWHDGDFPFKGDDGSREDSGPRLLHHCDGSQFVAFGNFLIELGRSDG